MKFICVVIAVGALAGVSMDAAVARNGGGHSGNSGVVHGPVHGPGSSHNPIRYKPVHGPGSSHNPIVATKPVVRDHRHHTYHGGGIHNGSTHEGGVWVTEGTGRRQTEVPTRVGGTTGSGFGGTVHDHR